MSIVQKEHGIDNSAPAAPSGRRYSTIVTFIDEVAKREPDDPPTVVDIFKTDRKWYCQVCRGDEKTQPLGPYTERQAERIQDARSMLLAKNGTSQLAFKQRDRRVSETLPRRLVRLSF